MADHDGRYDGNGDGYGDYGATERSGGGSGFDEFGDPKSQGFGRGFNGREMEKPSFFDRVISGLRSTSRCPYTKHLDGVLEEAAGEFYPDIKFMRVECPRYPGFCMTRQKKEYPFIEVFYNPEAGNPGKVIDPNITRYSVKVLPFNYDQSAYGFREFFKQHGMQASASSS